MITKLFFVDIETSGRDGGSALVPEQADIIEIAAVACEIDHRGYAVPVEIFERLIRPSGPLCEFSAPHFKNVVWPANNSPFGVMVDLSEFWLKHKGAWIGQHPTFDLSHIEPIVRRNGIPWRDKLGAFPDGTKVDYHLLDMASMVYPLAAMGLMASVSLSKSRIWAGCPGEQMHRALHDIRDEMAVFNALADYHRGREYIYQDPFQLEIKTLAVSGTVTI